MEDFADTLVACNNLREALIASVKAIEGNPDFTIHVVLHNGTEHIGNVVRVSSSRFVIENHIGHGGEEIAINLRDVKTFGI